ncbi:MAG TPA: DNA polymerase ligase N-terminal domain-containing protein [Pyrinomonadaceae bacterium]|nr:DNA polymerase ligase N-terminal domain-containing protein [Pyrinomonadaceae bacterium]
MKRKRFVIHEHHATRLHFDLRLEINGVLKSWAVPKGVSMNPQEKRLAVAVPDHSIGYIDFEGRLAEGTYGAGEVRIWDNGEFEIGEDAAERLAKGKLIFTFYGAKLKGKFTLLKMWNQEKNWLVIKLNDAFADKDWKLETVLAPKK